jgi:hypothetical protein
VSNIFQSKPNIQQLLALRQLVNARVEMAGIQLNNLVLFSLKKNKKRGLN